MRITVDVLSHGEVSITAASEREYRLRNLRIPIIENMGIIGDAYECLNFSDNSIVSLGGFPRMEMLESLILSNNQIKRIQRGLGHFLPNLTNLILINNNIRNITDLEPLVDCPKLVRVALIGNPVCKEPGYRHFIISKLPNLRTLDFTKVRKVERQEAEKHYGKNEQKLKEFVPGETPEEAAGYTKMTEEQRKRIQEAVKKAQTIEEVDRLDQMLASGRIPKGSEFSNSMDTT